MYKLEILKEDEQHLLSIGFLPEIQANNDEFVKYVDKHLSLMTSGGVFGGRLLLINGSCSLPIMAVIAHKLGRMYGAIAVFDPKLQSYVVSIAHGGSLAVGDLVKLSEVPVPQ
jgi:CRISPR-associated protein Csx3